MNTPAAPFSCELKYFHHTTYLNHFLNPFLFDFKFSLTGQADCWRCRSITGWAGRPCVPGSIQPLVAASQSLCWVWHLNSGAS